MQRSTIQYFNMAALGICLVSWLLTACDSGETSITDGKGDAEENKAQKTSIDQKSGSQRQDAVQIVKKNKSKSGNMLSSAYKKGVIVADIQRIKQLATLAMQFQLIKGRWPDSQAEFLEEMPEAKPLFGGNQKTGVRQTAELIYLPPANRNSSQPEPIVFIMDAAGEPDRSQTQGYTDGSVNKP